MDKKIIKQEVEELFTNPEPWEKWEKKFVIYSILAGIIGLVVLGILINVLILN